MLVPFMATQAWIRSLNYSIVNDWRPWFVKGQVAGYVYISDTSDIDGERIELGASQFQVSIGFEFANQLLPWGCTMQVYEDLFKQDDLRYREGKK